MTTSSDLEALEKTRRRMLKAIVITSLLWMLPQIFQGVFRESIPFTVNSILILAGIAGSLVWMVFMLKYNQFQTRVLGDSELKKRLDDERVMELRREAIYRGWFVLVAALGLGVFVAPFVELSGQVVLLSLMLLAVNGPIIFFLVLDRG